jgi:hypothetical protein
MGDIPRSDSEYAILEKQIELHNQYSQSEFVVHLGDIKAGSMPCTENIYIKVAEYLKKLDVPVFMVPGDNEWNDCQDPDEAWNLWDKYFMSFEKNWKNVYHILRQEERYENFAFIRKEVLLIGINLVGGRIHDQKEWDQILQFDSDWIKIHFEKNKKRVKGAVVFAQANPDEKHKLFIDQFCSIVIKFEKPVLFIHGDGHEWIHDDPWIVSNMIRVQVDKGSIAPPVAVKADHQYNKIFKFNRRPFELE